MSQRRISALLPALVLLAVVLLAACAGEGGTAPPAEQPAASAEDSQAASPGEAGQANLRFLWWGSDARHEATIAVIEAFQAEHPGIAIDAEYGGYDGFFEKLTTQMSGGTAADIIQYDASMTSDLLRIGDVFVDIYTMQDHMDLSGFDREFLENFCVYDGSLVGLPTGFNGSVLLTNTAVTDAAGIDIGAIRTWDDIIAAGRQLQAHNPDQHFINYELITVGKELIYSCLAQLTGKEVLSEEMTLNFTRDELYQVFDLIDRLYSSGTLQPAEESAVFDSSPQTNPKWISHDFASAMLITTFINDAYYDFQDTADIILQPQFENARESGAVMRPAQLIGISSDCASPEAALQFLDYFFNDEQSARTLRDVRSIPATEKARQICTDEGLLDPMAVKAIDLTLPIATNNQNLDVPEDITQIFQDGAAKVAYRQGTVDDIVDETMSLLESTLERLRS